MLQFHLVLFLFFSLKCSLIIFVFCSPKWLGLCKCYGLTPDPGSCFLLRLWHWTPTCTTTPALILSPTHRQTSCPSLAHHHPQGCARCLVLGLPPHVPCSLVGRWDGSGCQVLPCQPWQSGLQQPPVSAAPWQLFQKNPTWKSVSRLRKPAGFLMPC